MLRLNYSGWMFLLGVIFLAPKNLAAEEIQKKICQGPCAGPMAWVQSWNNFRGEVRLWEYQGDLNVCSHPPRWYYDGKGVLLGAMPETPINTLDPVSTSKARAGLSQVQDWRQGLSAGKKIYCGSN